MSELDPRKFRDPRLTATGEARAVVAPTGLRTLWFNTGTLCNLACRNCYIESSPRNDRLAYLTVREVAAFLDEVGGRDPAPMIGFTGGEPFMNPEFLAMLDETLARGFAVLVLTNAMRPMARHRERLVALAQAHPGRLTLRVSIDHHGSAVHDRERGAGSWRVTLDGMGWLVAHGVSVQAASRQLSGESEAALRAGYARLFAAERLPIDAADPVALVVFPEMDAGRDVPEITTACWSILHRSPDEMMCASSRMVVKRRGAAAPAVVACTLLPYEAEFELGTTVAEALRPVALNHPHCATFCVLGGAACSR